MKERKESIWGSHSFWMILCCAIPLVGIIILSLRRMASKDNYKGSYKNHMMRSKR